MYSLFTTKPTKPTKCFHGSACLTASKVHPVSPLLAHDLYILHELGGRTGWRCWLFGAAAYIL